MITDVPAVAAFLERSVSDFTDDAVVGISGGVDSSVVASICVAALGPGSVHLVSMPYDDEDTQTFNRRSRELATGLGALHHVVSIGRSAQALLESLEGAFPERELHRLTPANIRPRVRMNVLYAISGELGYASQRRVRVIGTGHLSEDLIGYDTKGGDALCDIFILSDLVKSEVYQLARHYRVPRGIIEAPPSAGLYPGQTDADELGYTYDELEAPTLALHRLLREGMGESEIDPGLDAFAGLDPKAVAFVVARYRAHSHKHAAPATVEVRNQEWFRAP